MSIRQPDFQQADKVQNFITFGLIWTTLISVLNQNKQKKGIKTYSHIQHYVKNGYLYTSMSKTHIFLNRNVFE